MKKLILVLSMVFVPNLLSLNLDIASLKTSIETSLQAIKDKGITLTDNQKSGLQIVGVLCGAYLGYNLIKKSYSSLKSNIEQEFENKFVHLIKLQFQSNKNCSDSELRDKAWAINIRKCLKQKLSEISSSDSRWSTHFDKALKKFIATFIIVDTTRSMLKSLGNKYEQEYTKTYEQLSYIDKKLVDTLVNNILLKYKPENLCTEQEKLKKQEIKERAHRIQEKLKIELVKGQLAKSFLDIVI
ncbi:MAG: hypothetical protein P4L22_06405 [Candidatus Babeliales bacterium]|nr:hypothetical protein [Candidatus Babeliales bacterium]